MKFLCARIRNFKLLRTIDLEFSQDPDRPLTVIRAENGSGKTSTLQALRWGLYGNRVLEDRSVRLSPSDWPQETVCKVSVEIEFIHTSVSIIAAKTMVAENRYVLVRQVEEQPEDNFPNRSQEQLDLFHKTESGANPVDGAESRLQQMLPGEMLDIFFTDGDAAMTFISPQLTEDAKQDQVRNAIRTLLGLELLEKAGNRIRKLQSQTNRDISRNTESKELAAITDKITDLTTDKEKAEDAKIQADREIKETKRELDETSKKLLRALEAGNYEDLARQQQMCDEQLQAMLQEEEDLKRQHQLLFQDETLSWTLMEMYMQKGFLFLQNLRSQGIIPGTAVPVLEECLDVEQCICGAPLSQGTEARAHVADLIEQQRKDNASMEHLTELYFQAKSARGQIHAENVDWLCEAQALQNKRTHLAAHIKKVQHEEQVIKAKLDTIDEEQIEQLRQNEQTLHSVLSQYRSMTTEAQMSLHSIEEKLKPLIPRKKELEAQDLKVANLIRQQKILEDLERIVKGTLEAMQDTYVRKVSELMNRLFLYMVGADPEQGAIFQGVGIDADHNIVVWTKDGNTLNPTFEVNGASQRALTFSLIWALTEVSGVTAPRVIDTPLGMMSGNVKRRVLAMVSQPVGQDVDRQVILFLTQSEISHTEDILDGRVGTFTTLTKTDDFPTDLLHDPGAVQPEVRQCQCSHRQYCDLCQRRNYQDFALQYRPQ